MRFFAIALISTLILVGCAGGSKTITTYNGRHIDDVVAELGIPDNISPYQDGAIYSWGEARYSTSANALGLSTRETGCFTRMITDKDGIVKTAENKGPCLRFLLQ